MGKPFKSELSFINETYDWAKSVELKMTSAEMAVFVGAPTFVVGSGGSFSACHMLSVLQQDRGIHSKPVTPLELHYASNAIRNSNIVFLSASGKNSDILFAYNTAIKHDPLSVLGICMKTQSKLSQIASRHPISKIFEFESPAGKDGFLATNSLVAYFTLLSRFFGHSLRAGTLGPTEAILDKILKFVSQLDPDFTMLVLYAGWTQPVAIDIESKFTEAGLGNVLFSDFRNFGHGRHNWLDKKKRQSAIVALVTPEETELAKKTLSLVPEKIPKLILSSEYSSALSSIDILIQSFYLAAAVGDKTGIDPGRPGVPGYGSKLYNLRYQSIVGNAKKDYNSINAILRKSGKPFFGDLSKNERQFWQAKLNNFKKKINSERFGAVILDYDGTLCSQEQRRKLPSAEVVQLINSFIRRGFIVGIVTGRGKSIRTNLLECLDNEFIDNVIIGYYNGAVIAPVTDSSQPNINIEPKGPLKEIYEMLKTSDFPDMSLDISLRPWQLTIEDNSQAQWEMVKSRIIEFINKFDYNDIRIMESGHSIDIIIKSEASKLNIIAHCVEKCRTRGVSERFVCIGDKGKFPGNDYELLASEYSLSVDEVSSDPDTCWNLADFGNRGVSAFLQYLNSAIFTESYFNLSI